MTRPDDGCLCCGHDHTCNGFLCTRCYRQRVHTRHWRWTSIAYRNAVESELSGWANHQRAGIQRQGMI